MSSLTGVNIYFDMKLVYLVGFTDFLPLGYYSVNNYIFWLIVEYN